jgi:undecaprenyl-diphosphatase
VGLLQAFVLGIVQGLTEFLPISSSGHLVVVPFIFGWDEPTLAFTVAAHVGTLIAVIVVFSSEVRQVVRTVLGWKHALVAERAIVRFLAIGTVPAVVVGVVFELIYQDKIEMTFERPVLASFLLGVTAWWLMSTETKVAHREVPGRLEQDLQTADAGWIGVAQAVAILPGISRSGATIAAGMRLGFAREAAARFSFLLAIPAILGATVLSLPDIVDQGLSGSGPAFVIGLMTSFGSGFLAIRWFLRLVARRDMKPFGTYLMLMMVAGLLTSLARG